jgi:GntR family transcriptional regulator
VSETYLEVANEIEKRIHGLDVGVRVPSESEVVREFAISRPTARAALQELERRFFVRRVKGSGTYVNQRIPYPIGSNFPASASRTLAMTGHTASIRIVTVSQTEPSAEEAKLFQPDVPHLLCIVGRIMDIGEETVGFGFSKISTLAAPGIQQHLSDIKSIWRIFDSVYGIRLQRKTTTVSLDLPPIHIAKILGTREPAWHIQSINVDEASQAVAEIGDSWLRTDRMAVTVHFEAKKFEDQLAEVDDVYQKRSA